MPAHAAKVAAGQVVALPEVTARLVPIEVVDAGREGVGPVAGAFLEGAQRRVTQLRALGLLDDA